LKSICLYSAEDAGAARHSGCCGLQTVRRSNTQACRHDHLPHPSPPVTSGRQDSYRYADLDAAGTLAQELQLELGLSYSVNSRNIGNKDSVYFGASKMLCGCCSGSLNKAAAPCRETASSELCSSCFPLTLATESVHLHLKEAHPADRQLCWMPTRKVCT
jgi:hypothetical protein